MTDDPRWEKLRQSKDANEHAALRAMTDQPVLECQQCGHVLRRLTPGEAQQVALNPYDFVAFCRSCAADQTSYPSVTDEP